VPFADPLYERQEPALKRQIRHVACWPSGRRHWTLPKAFFLLSGPELGPKTVGEVRAAGEHRHSAATAGQGGAMSGDVDASITAQQRAVTRAVQSAADDLGATASQVAIACTRARSRAIHPIIGALRLAQLQDNLGAAQLGLPPEIAARLDAAAGIDLGFPATFIQDNAVGVWRGRAPSGRLTARA
jgi:Aldo/keto reductase family